jgi:hypothetical protein
MIGRNRGLGACKQTDRPTGFLSGVGMLFHSCYMHIDATLLSAVRITVQQMHTEYVGPTIDTGQNTLRLCVQTLLLLFACSDGDKLTGHTAHSFKINTNIRGLIKHLMSLLSCKISVLKMETAGSSRTVVPICEVTRITSINVVFCQDSRRLQILKSL